MASKTATVSGVPVKTEYTLVGDKITGQTNSGTTLYFCYDINGDVFGFIYNNQSYYYLKNLLGDVIKVLDSNGNEVVSYSYDTWGVCTASNNSIIGAINPFRYRSYYFDTDSGLYFLQSRYYDPSIGRFINSDDISYLGANRTLVSYNVFAYCSNNAVNKIDPKGSIDYCKLIIVLQAFANYIYNSQFSVPYYIYGQNNYPVSEMMYGSCKMSWNGCELIAIYNALHLTHRYANLAEIVFWFDTSYGKLVDGVFGTAPHSLSGYLRDSRIRYVQYLTYNGFNKAKRSGRIYIISTWNDFSKKDYGIHTFAVRCTKDGKFETYNFSVGKKTKKKLIWI